MLDSPSPISKNKTDRSNLSTSLEVNKTNRVLGSLLVFTTPSRQVGTPLLYPTSHKASSDLRKEGIKNNNELEKAQSTFKSLGGFKPQLNNSKLRLEI